MTKIKENIADGFANLLSALGGANPKTAANTYFVECSNVELEAAYRTSTWFGKIVDIPADDAVREWRSWQAENDEIERIEAEEKRLQVRQKVRQALIWSRLYGGAVIIPGNLPGNPSTPLNVESVRPGSIKFLNVLNRYQINPGAIIKNPLDPNHGEPEYYDLNSNEGGQVRMHPSRVVRVNGRPAPSTSGDINSGWGDSVWMHMQDAVTSADAGAAVVASLLQEAKIDVVRLPGMMSNLATQEYESMLIRRFRIAASLKSVNNMLLLDKDDEWDQKQIEWTGLTDVIGILLSIMSGAADISVTRLIGTSAKGLNATGEGDLRNYYDSVKAKQELILQPQIMQLDNMLVRSANIDRNAWYKWNPLYQMSEKELSENDKRDAETSGIYALNGLVPIDALEKATQNRMIESGRWPGLEAGIKESNVEIELPPEEDLTLTGDAAPRTLYIRRNVLNATDIIAWAKSQGFKTTLPADDMHVTIVFSRALVNWMKVGQPWESQITVSEGGPRLMETFGEGARVLLFASNELEWRHKSAKESGASWDHEEYQPHITISYGDMPDNVEPYQGEIVLGPEIFEEINENWQTGVVES